MTRLVKDRLSLEVRIHLRKGVQPPVYLLPLLL